MHDAKAFIVCAVSCPGCAFGAAVGEPPPHAVTSSAAPASTAAARLTSVLQLGQWVAPANPSSPQFRSAMQECQHLLLMRPPTATQVQQQLNREVKAAACMRAHGYPDYPDPTEQDGHMVRPDLPSDIDTSSPRFQAALQKCTGG